MTTKIQFPSLKLCQKELILVVQSIEPLTEGNFYHIYNRGINGCDIFPEDKNFNYFLQLYEKHVSKTVETLAYCLLRNHFHLLIRIKTETEIEEIIAPSRKFSNLFNAYAQGFNKVYSRTGGLFETPFHRKRVDNMEYRQWLVWYIHANPQRHGLTDDFRSWPGSSYSIFLNGLSSAILNKEATIKWFDNLDGFS